MGLKFNTGTEFGLMKAKEHFENMCASGKTIEVIIFRTKRTIKQNAYLHVVLKIYAIHFGHTLAKVKKDLKKLCPFMHYEENGVVYFIETSEMNTIELGAFIDWIRTYSANNGKYIESSREYLKDQARLDNEFELNKEFL